MLSLFVFITSVQASDFMIQDIEYDLPIVGTIANPNIDMYC